MRPFLYLLLLLLATGCTLPFSSKSTLEQTGKCRELTHLGVSSMEAGRIDEAIVHLKAAKKVYPYDVEARRQLGEALWRKGDAQGAIKELQEAVKLRKEGADITRVAEMFLTIRQFQLAKEAALDAIDVEPENGKAWAVKARALLGLQDYNAALPALQKAVGLAPDDVTLLNDLAAYYHWSGRLDEELLALAEIIVVSGEATNDIRRRQGEAYLAKGNFEKAKAVLAEALSDPKLQENERKDLLALYDRTQSGNAIQRR